MENRFHHIDNPYAKKFDYEKWRGNRVFVYLLSVKWDSSYANVPGFETRGERKRWFDAQKAQVIELQTNVREWYTSLKVPLTFDEAQGYNYARVVYDAAPVESFGAPDQRELYFFIDEIADTPAPSTTELAITLDVWTTYITSLHIGQVYLERGHLPLSKINASDFLKNPIEKCGLLLDADVTGGETKKVTETKSVVFNDVNSVAVIATTCNPVGFFGSAAAKNWQIPTGIAQTQGAPNVWFFSCTASETVALLNAANAANPSFMQTIQAVFFVAEKLLLFGASFDFAGKRCRFVDAAQVKLSVIEFNEQLFDYPKEYADLAKLYTGAYSRIALSDGQGSVTYVNVEETTGRIDLQTTLNLAASTVSIQGVLQGVGGSKSELTFANINAESFAFSGSWYNKLMSWHIPTYAITQSAYDNASATDFYSREQSKLAAENAYTSATASASTSLSNTQAGNAASVANTATQLAANLANVSRSIEAANEDYGAQNSLNTAMQAYGAGYSRAVTAIEVEGQQQSAGVSIGGTVASSIAGAVSGAATGAAAGTLAGAVGALPGAIAGGAIGAIAPIVSGAVSGCTTAANTAVSVNLSSSKTEAGISNTANTTAAINQNNADRTDVQNRAQTDLNSIASNAAITITNNSAATSNSNAASTYNTSVANAQSSRDTALAAVQAGWNASKLAAPKRFGADNEGFGRVRPLGLFASIETMLPSDVKRVGDAFLRYGYVCERAFDFKTFNVMSHFSFWKISDIWATNNAGISAKNQNMLESILKNGVTVWKNPEEIGSVSIYDNRS